MVYGSVPVKVVAKIYGKTPEWVRYGVKNDTQHTMQ